MASSSSSSSSSRFSILINIVTAMVAFLATFIGIFVYTTIPTKLGLYTYWANTDPMLIGMTPATLYGVPWNYTFDELYGNTNNNNLNGQNAIVTGASSGIGYAMSYTLAKLGAHVTMACRNPTKCQTKANEIRQQLQLEQQQQQQQQSTSDEENNENNNNDNNIKISTMTIDTSSFKSVKQFADKYIASFKNTKLDMLFLNAGTGHNTNKTHPCIPLSDEDGIEYVFQTNYLGHHLLYRLLEPLLLRRMDDNNSSGGGSNDNKISAVVQTSSASSFSSYTYKVATNLTTLNGCLENPMSKGENLSYAQSKLAQILWVQELTKRLGSESNIIANAFHPGLVNTEIFDKCNLKPQWLADLVKYFARTAGWDPMEGALTGLFLGVEKERLLNEGIRGKYFHPIVNEIHNHSLASNQDELQKKLWDFSDSLVKDYL